MVVDYKDIAVRAGKTFLQAFLAVLAAGLAGVTGFDTLGNLGFAALIAGISALVSWVQIWIIATSQLTFSYSILLTISAIIRRRT